MSDDTDRRPIISRESLVPLGGVASIVLGLIAGAYQFHNWSVSDVKWKTKMESSVQSIQETLSGSSQWGRSDMREWRNHLRESNPEMNVPEVPEK